MGSFCHIIYDLVYFLLVYGILVTSGKYCFVLVPCTVFVCIGGTGVAFTPLFKVKKRAKIRNRYNQAPHLAQDTNGKVAKQTDITNESQEVRPSSEGDHKVSINRRARKLNKNKTEIT